LRLAALAATLLLPLAAAAQTAGPVGTWRTFSDRTGQENGQVQIFEQGGLLYGRITGITDPAKRDATCTKCSDDRKDRPVMGLDIIRGLHRDGDAWDGGTILDPENGSVYRCIVRLKDGGSRLVVRGFIGISLFGRSQTWVRAK
jgi:uncharacterized protein (DUF2147 family)